MTDINTLVTENFNDNISYIEASQPELFTKLSALESAIELGHYQEKYELLYEESYFDVFEKSTGNYLYGKDSNTHALLASESIDYALNDNLFESFHQHPISDADLKRYGQTKPLEHQMSGFAPIMHYCQTHLPKKKPLKKINKFLFFGTGLGLHVDSIHRKIHAKVYFIIEDDLELFRLSLFSTNYKKIAADATLVFSVFENNDDFSKSAAKFLETKHFYNHYLKYFHILSHSEEKRNQFHIATTTQAHLLFFYNDLLTQYLKPLEYMFGEYRFISKTLDFSDNVLNDKPFLLIAAGPSLQKNKEWLKENHHRFITVAISATLSFLEKEGISPDIITHLDAFDFAIQHFDKLDSLEFVKDSLCIFSSRTPHQILSKFNPKQIFLFETGTKYQHASLKPSAPCIGSLTYQLLLVLKAKTIYLLGLDLAIDKTTGKTHSDAHEYAQTLDTKESAFEDSVMRYRESVYTIEGNLSETVLTTPNFQISIDAINLSTKLLKQEHQSVFNLNEGARFIAAIAKRVDELIVPEGSPAPKIRQHLYDLSAANSAVGLSSIEIDDLNKKLLHAKEIRKAVIDYQETEITSAQEYLLNLQRLCSMLTDQKEIRQYELSRVIDTYLKYILSYIFYFFNTAALQEEKSHFRKIDELLTEHLLQIIDFYHESVSSKLN